MCDGGGGGEDRCEDGHAGVDRHGAACFSFIHDCWRGREGRDDLEECVFLLRIGKMTNKRGNQFLDCVVRERRKHACIPSIVFGG